MQAQARTTGVRVSTRKVRLIADAVRNMPVAKAIALLTTTQKRGASILLKTLNSAVANALQKGNVDEANLVITQLEVDGGPTLRRMHIGSRSHVRMYTKRSTHIRIVVSDMQDKKKEVRSANSGQEGKMKKEVQVKTEDKKGDK